MIGSELWFFLPWTVLTGGGRCLLVSEMFLTFIRIQEPLDPPLACFCYSAALRRLQPEHRCAEVPSCLSDAGILHECHAASLLFHGSAADKVSAFRKRNQYATAEGFTSL